MFRLPPKNSESISDRLLAASSTEFKPNARVATDVNVDRFLRLLVDRIA
jgi:hypothetical protein